MPTKSLAELSIVQQGTKVRVYDTAQRRCPNEHPSLSVKTPGRPYPQEWGLANCIITSIKTSTQMNLGNSSGNNIKLIWSHPSFLKKNRINPFWGMVKAYGTMQFFHIQLLSFNERWQGIPRNKANRKPRWCNGPWGYLDQCYSIELSAVMKMFSVCGVQVVNIHMWLLGTWH